MDRLIYANALKERKFPNSESEYATGWNDAISAIMTFQPTIDAIPVEFIQELIKQDKQYIEEYGGYTDYDVIVDGLIERVVNYEALIEKWREKNGKETD